MNQTSRTCKIQGHEDYPVFHICTLFECNQISRWCCSECFQKMIHHHNQSNDSHIMNSKEIITKLKNEYEQQKEHLEKHKIGQSNLLERIIKECLKLEKSLKEYLKQHEQLIQETSDQDQAKFEQYLSSLSDNNFEQLDDDKINQLLNNYSHQFNQNRESYLQQPLNQIKKFLNQIDSIIKDYKTGSKFIFDLENRNYIIKEIDQTDDHYCGSQISNDEQYLSYGACNEKLLKIYDLNLNKIIKLIKQENSIQVCQFTQDSSQLYVGLSEGDVHGYDVMDEFKEIFKQQIHKKRVNSIITIQNKYLITCSDDKTIIKTDIKGKQQIFILNGHTGYISSIDFNYKDEVIISGSYDQSIKLWNCNNHSIIINKFQAHHNYISQIQLINKNLNILSLDIDGNLYQWIIDLINMDLTKIFQFTCFSPIRSFYQVNQNQNFLLINDNMIEIINQQGEFIKTILHGGGKGQKSCECKQIDNLNYIQIRTEKKIILAIAQD